MIQLAAPLGLLALGALLAPILIHLVRRPLRHVRIGSLRFLPAEQRQVRSLRWHEWLLLALRCALLAALVLALAGVRWQPDAPAPARWLLLVPGTKLDATSRAEWDRRRAEGFEPRQLSHGFPAATTPPDYSAHADVDAWSLLREIDSRLPAGSRAIVFGPTWSTQFRGARPALAHVEVSWRQTPDDPPALTSAGSARVGLVASPDRAPDARYLRAALAAIGATVVTDDAPEWIFQLGDVALPPAWAERMPQGAHLVTDAPNLAPAIGVTRWFEMGAGAIRLRQRVALEAGVPMRRDSAGEPWFTEERKGAGRHWRFAFRFHPDWSDWPLESAFPAWWRTQLQPLPDTALTIAPAVATPRFAPATAATAPSPPGYGRIDLRAWCWLLAVALFVLERALSGSARRRREVA